MRALAGMTIVAIVGLVLTVIGLVALNEGATLIGLCVLLGLSIKGMDQAVDLDSMSGRRHFAYLFAAGIPVITIYLALHEDPVFGMILGTAIGLLLAGKWDHPSFFVAGIGFIVFSFGFILLFDVEIATTSYYLVPMAAVGNYLDEFAHDRTAGTGGRAERYMEHRPILKVVGLIAVLIGFAEWIHLAGLLAFDLSYDLIAVVWKD